MIENYLEEEKKYRPHISNYLKASFKPGVFQMDNYPTTINEHRELEGYIDEMKHNKGYIFNIITNEDFKKKFELICKIISDITFENFKKKIVPISSLLYDLKYAETCFNFLKNISKPRIFEIGPGSGYFGFATGLQNIQYSSTDITMGFYLWQSLIYQRLDKNFKIDFKTHDYELFNENNLVSHNTWWKMAELYKYIDETKNNFCDIIFCSNSFAEFSNLSQLYYIKIGKKLLLENFKKNNRIGFFYLPNFGKFYDVNQSNNDIINKFEKNDFVFLSMRSGFIFILKETIKNKIKMPNLNFLNSKYGNIIKKYLIKEYFKKFVKSEEIKNMFDAFDVRILSNIKNKEIDKLIINTKQKYEVSNNYKINNFLNIPINL